MKAEEHTLEKQIDIIINVLWALRNDSKFYFATYGEDMIKSLIKRQKQSELYCPNPDCKSINIIHKETYDYCKDCRRMFNGKSTFKTLKQLRNE